MLWKVGQQRETREHRERMAAMFVAARDADLDVGVATGRLTPKGAWHQPPYIDSPEQRSATTRRGLAQLIADFPGNVVPGKEFIQ